MQPKLFAGRELSVRELIDRYLAHGAAVNLWSDEALDERKRTLGLFSEACGNLPVSECRPFHLTDWIEEHPRWKSSSTRKAKANQVNAAFNWSVSQGRIGVNPFAGVRYEEADPRQPMEDSALAEVVLRSNKRYERAVRFLRMTGCRISDMARTTWSDVDIAGRRIVLQKHKTRKKTGKQKIIPLVPEAIELLLLIRREQGDDYQGTVFLNNRGTPWNRRTIGQHLRRLKERHDIKTEATTHGIRHQWSRTALRNHADLKAVSLGLGHSSTAITQKIYGHVEGDIDYMMKAAEAAQARGYRHEATPNS